MNRAALAVAGVRAVLRNAGLRRVQLGWGSSIVAEWIHFVALGVFAYDAGGAVAVGVVGAIRMIPAALLAPFAALLADRFRREVVLAAMATTAAFALAGSAVAASWASGEAVVYALAALVGIGTTLIRPAQQALLPSLARTPAELVAANGATSTFEGLGTLVGPLAAGVVVAALDTAAAFALGAGAFVASAVLFAGVHVEARLAAGVSAARGELVAGLRLIARARKPRLVVGLMGAQAFVRGCLNVLIVVTAFEVLDAGPAAVGYMTAAIGVGAVLGALGAFTLTGGRLAVPFGLALVFWGLPIALVAPWPYTAVAVALLALVGAANSVEDVAGFTLLQRIVPDQVLARVLGGVWGIAMGGVALGSLAAPLLVELAGARAALLVVGALLPALTLASWRQLREIDRSVSAPVEGLEVVSHVEMFAPLSLAAKEHIASRLMPVEAARGHVVMREGEAGDRFYVVIAGELSVRANGVDATMREGDSFGEIALLRDVARTATVTAVTDARLAALERRDFLAAMGAHDEVRAAGETVAEERLARSSY